MTRNEDQFKEMFERVKLDIEVIEKDKYLSQKAIKLFALARCLFYDEELRQPIINAMNEIDKLYPGLKDLVLNSDK